MLRFRRKSSAKCRRSLIWMTLPDPTRCSGCCPPFALKDRLPKPWPELQMRIMQLAREGSPPPGLRLPQAELSRKSNLIARGRIRRFESDMPQSLCGRVRRGEICPTFGRVGLRYDQVTVIAESGGWYFAQDLTNTLRFVIAAVPRARATLYTGS